MSTRALEFVIPGDLHSASGGYVYDRSMAAGLDALDWRVNVRKLDASFPSPTSEALAQAERVFAGLPDRACVLVDGLALGAIAHLVEAHAHRLTLVALIHMPLASEFGIAPAVAERLRRQERSALRWVRHAIVTSRCTEHELGMYGVEQSRVSVVEPGVWTAPLADASGDCAREGAVRMLCVATIQEGKGHEMLIEALAPLAHLPWRLQCVGSLSRSVGRTNRSAARYRSLSAV